MLASSVADMELEKKPYWNLGIQGMGIQIRFCMVRPLIVPLLVGSVLVVRSQGVDLGVLNLQLPTNLPKSYHVIIHTNQSHIFL